MTTTISGQLRRIAFIDLEASGLGSAGFPTELGWAVVKQDGSITSDSFLIRPVSRWTRYTNAWSAASEALTGISREMLDCDGLSPAAVMKRFLAAVEGCELFSDAPDFDHHWLNMLSDAAMVDLVGREIGNAKTLIEEAGGKAALAGEPDGPRHSGRSRCSTARTRFCPRGAQGMKPILFLDVDGVLLRRRHPGMFDSFELAPGCLGFLE
jgi:hypothetical protein